MGELQIIFEQTKEPPYDHMSISHPSRRPTLEELEHASTALGGARPSRWVWLPEPEHSRSMQANVVHLYVMPPESLLGF